MFADWHRAMLKDAKTDEERKKLENEIRIYDFLAECDISDKCALVRSSAFNDIIMEYLEFTLDNVRCDEDIKREMYQTFHDALYEGIEINTEGAYNYRFRE